MPTVQGIIDFALSPPLGSLTPHLDTSGPFAAGNHQITQFSGSVPVADTFGLLVRMSSLNAFAGYTDGFVSLDGLIDGNVYDNWLCQIGVQHQMLGGAWALTQLENVLNVFVPILWHVALPGRLGLYVPPLNAVDLYYLRVG